MPLETREEKHILAALNAALLREQTASYVPYIAGNQRQYRCTIPDCPNNGYAKGLCNAHYGRKRKGKDPLVPLRCRKRSEQCNCGHSKGKRGSWDRCSVCFKKYRTYVIKKTLVDVFGGKCGVCDGIFPTPVYDFHHLGNKNGAVGEMINTCSIETIAREAAKCTLICANCHRIKHNGRI